MQTVRSGDGPRPGGHSVQTAELVDEMLPAGHDEHAPPFAENVPAGQGRHVAPSGDGAEPAAQVAQALDPLCSATVPLGHGRQEGDDTGA